MGIVERKAELEREIKRRERELEKLEALPEFGEVANGTVLGLAVTLGRSQPYAFIAYKVRDRWFLTGKNSPNGVSSDELAEWLTTGGRRLELAAPLAEFELASVPVSAIDLGALMAEATRNAAGGRRRGSEWRDQVCEDDSCGCSGRAHF